jgi:DUF1680 family protein
MNRLLASLGNYLYGVEGDTLYINQFGASDVTVEGITASVETDYPRDGRVTVTATGASVIAIRIPAWCDRYTVDKPYTLKDGYALVENDGTPVNVIFDLSPRRVWADARVLRAAGHAAVMRGPVVYCAEGLDNGERELHNYVLSRTFTATEEGSDAYGLPILSVPCIKRVTECGSLYSNTPPKTEEAVLKLIPYNAFANRDETDMRVWFLAE